MLIVAIILLLVIIFLLTRLFALKKEIRKISKQLQNFNTRNTNKKIDVSLFDQDIENLGLEMNNLIDLYVKENRARVKFEDAQKQTVANMSHDLRTPLTSVLGYIQMAESNEATEDEKKEWLAIAYKRAKRLESLLAEFFELTIIDSNDHQLKPKRMNIKNVTLDIIMGFYDRFNESNMEPSIQLPEKDVFIYADESAVMRVIENLISNALIHSDGNIVISLEKMESTARLIVKNDAYTLTEKDVQCMLDRFYKADQSRTRKNTGLGLSIVKSLMDKMNGTITGSLNNAQLAITCEWKLQENDKGASL